MRAFLAIDLPDTAREAISRLQDDLKPGRKVPEENLHLTLAFLDDQPQSVLEHLHGALGDLTFAPFDLTLSGLDLFGGKRPRLIYLKADGGAALTGLHKALRGVARVAGIDLPRERFRPHVTLARFRRDLEPGQVAQIGSFLEAYHSIALAPFTVTGFSLFASTLHPDGAVHEELACYPSQT
ncbi:RNA 2',3'-cyclic phosphodiesterase [uncultured Shimia sp.]|uniref:RNA 2',3'-cyclic phosphodiesterase n=1 Tax=uncultured Shimia sp. TaxID=573152 RepID=UPI0026379C70|nr:RNA 2',3'-cyclic phosphodiesterase [uncultured Shimia sp.]